VSRIIGASARFGVSEGAASIAIVASETARVRSLLGESLDLAGSPPRIRRLSVVTAEALNVLTAAIGQWNSALQKRGERLASLSAASDRLVSATEKASLAIAAERRQRRAEILQAQARLRATVIWATAAAGLVGLSITTALVLSITRSTQSLAAAMEDIAAGTLDHAIPNGSSDELGQLLAATKLMRDRVQTRVEHEIEERRSAQKRLVDALESSQEGVVLVDSTGHLVIVNSQMARFYPTATDLLQPGAAFVAFAAATGAAAVLEADLGNAPEIPLADGRWVRVSRSATQGGGFVAITSDITALKQREAELRETNLRFDAALAAMSQGLALFDAGQRLQVSNRRMAEICGIPTQFLRPGVTLKELVDESVAVGNYGEQAASDVHADYLAVIARAQKATLNKTFSDGRVVAISHEPLESGGWLLTYDDITDRRRTEVQVAYMAHHDALTGLPNRVLLRERLDHAVAQLGRGHDFAVLCLDLDKFKPVNDTLGHPVGDKLLQAVAERLGACVRETDTVARLGGDEFAIVQIGFAGPEDAGKLAERIVEAIGRPFDIDGHRVTIGTSIGIAVAPHDGHDWETLLKNADIALYRAKSGGRGVYCSFEQGMDAQLHRRHRLEQELRQALPNGELEVFYQPLVSIASERVVDFEALLRWHHPERGLVPPSEFIPIAEETGLIIPIGEWVLRQACADAAFWAAGINVAVNISATQFGNSHLLEAVVDALAASGLEARRLELEVTESVLLLDESEAMLHQLRRLGIRIALDDFGTGYSSLNYLCRFPFDKLKIDQSFVRDLARTAEAATIVRAIIDLGIGLGMRITAEGVETQEQLDCLRDAGCMEVQGYLFSRPVRSGAISALLDRFNELEECLLPLVASSPA